MEDYAKAIVSMCERHGIAIIGLFKINTLDPADAELVLDGLHTSDNGHSIMARIIAEELLRI